MIFATAAVGVHLVVVPLVVELTVLSCVLLIGDVTPNVVDTKR